jgi:maltooligosyltrehalose trehalohydrolase
MVDKGRKAFMSQFPSVSGTLLPDPTNVNTFTRCRLDPADRRRSGPLWWLHSDLLTLRRDDEVFAAVDDVDGAVLGTEAFLLRFSSARGERLLLVNLGRDLALQETTDPLLAAPAESRWQLQWSSEQQRYGGVGSGQLRTEPFVLPGQSALVLRPVPLVDRPLVRDDD